MRDAKAGLLYLADAGHKLQCLFDAGKGVGICSQERFEGDHVFDMQPQGSRQHAIAIERRDRLQVEWCGTICIQVGIGTNQREVCRPDPQGREQGRNMLGEEQVLGGEEGAITFGGEDSINLEHGPIEEQLVVERVIALRVDECPQAQKLDERHIQAVLQLLNARECLQEIGGDVVGF